MLHFGANTLTLSTRRNRRLNLIRAHLVIVRFTQPVSSYNAHARSPRTRDAFYLLRTAGAVFLRTRLMGDYFAKSRQGKMPPLLRKHHYSAALYRCRALRKLSMKAGAAAFSYFIICRARLSPSSAANRAYITEREETPPCDMRRREIYASFPLAFHFDIILFNADCWRHL